MYIKSQSGGRKDMINIVTEEDLTALRHEFNEAVKLLTDRITVLEKQLKEKEPAKKAVVSKITVKCTEELEMYVDKMILDANIPNLDAEELEKFKSRSTRHYIADIVYKYADKKDKQYLMKIPYKKGTTRIDNWAKDSEFSRILMYCLPEYISKYLMRRYKNVATLKIQQDRAAVMHNKMQSNTTTEPVVDEIVGKCNSKQFKKRLDRAIRDFKTTTEYKNDYHSLGMIIKDTLSLFSKQQIEECHRLYFQEHNKYATRDIDVIGLNPVYAFTFIEAFETEVYGEPK